MNTWRRLASMSTLLAVALASIAVPTSAATGTTRWVDGDGRAGPSGCGSSRDAFKKIQKAIDASDTDDTIVVCPGTYVEQLVIRGDRDGLTLRSSSPYQAIIKTPSDLDSSSGVNTHIRIQYVDDVTVRGFQVHTRTAAPCENTDIVIMVFGSQRTGIRGNRLLSPGAGRPSQACYASYGVFALDQVSSSQAPRRTGATIGFNEIRDVYSGIYAAGGTKRVDVDIVHNSIRFYWGAPPSGPITPRTDESGGFGAVAQGNVSGTIRDNVIQGSLNGPNTPDSSEFVYGIFLIAPTSGFVVQDNLVRRVLIGMFVVSVEDATIRRNTISNAFIGLYLLNTEDTRVLRNEVTTKQTGILVDSNSSDNTLRDNTFSGNGSSCDDGSSGTGTSGTANTWTGNTAAVSNPSGICSPP